MSSNESVYAEKPPCYPSIKPTTPTSTASTAYHIKLLRFSKAVTLVSGNQIAAGYLEHRDVAISLLPTDTWTDVREKVWLLFQLAWPAILSKHQLKDYAMGMRILYTASTDRQHSQHVDLIDYKEAALWEFMKRTDIKVINLSAVCAPRVGVATQLGHQVAGLENGLARRGGKKQRARCVLQ
jgi:hypothetical protein